MKWNEVVVLAAWCVVEWQCAEAARDVAVDVHHWRAVVVHEYPHDPAAFTQGLLCNPLTPTTVAACTTLFESTGLYGGASSVREVDLATGTVLRKASLDAKLFGEGLALLGSRLYQLTWREKLLVEWDAVTLSRLQMRAWRVSSEGWGLASNESKNELIASDGSSILRFVDADSLDVTRVLHAMFADGSPATRLNELEVINDEIWANVWYDDTVLRIDPQSGFVVGIIDISDVVRRAGPRRTADDVANGIAFDRSSQKLFLTGKHWPSLFEIKLQHVSASTHHHFEEL